MNEKKLEEITKRNILISKYKSIDKAQASVKSKRNFDNEIDRYEKSIKIADEKLKKYNVSDFSSNKKCKIKKFHFIFVILFAGAITLILNRVKICFDFSVIPVNLFVLLCLQIFAFIRVNIWCHNLYCKDRKISRLDEYEFDDPFKFLNRLDFCFVICYVILMGLLLLWSNEADITNFFLLLNILTFLIGGSCTVGYYLFRFKEISRYTIVSFSGRQKYRFNKYYAIYGTVITAIITFLTTIFPLLSKYYSSSFPDDIINAVKIGLSWIAFICVMQTLGLQYTTNVIEETINHNKELEGECIKLLLRKRANQVIYEMTESDYNEIFEKIGYVQSQVNEIIEKTNLKGSFKTLEEK